MGSLILPSATAALAYKRLGDVIDRLTDKINGPVHDSDIGFIGGARTDRTVVNNVERRVLGLATATQAMFQGGGTTPVPPRATVPPGLSSYALLGAVAWEWPRLAQILDSAQPWVGDAMRRGTADPNRSHAAVDSLGFALGAGAAALGHAADDDERVKVRAWTMGLIAGAASQVVVSPVLRGHQRTLTNRRWTPSTPGHVIAHAEAAALDRLFGGTASGSLPSWLPPGGDVPQAIFDGYIEALETTYGFPSARPPGFEEFELGFVDADDITAQRLRSAQSFLHQSTVTSTWGPGTWWLALSPGLVAVPLTLLIAKALPNAKNFFEAGPNPGERGAYELLTLGMGLGSLAPFGWSMYLWSQLDGMTESFVNSLVMGITRIGLTTASLATHHLDLGAAARWAGFWLPMQGIDIYALVRGIVHATQGRPGDAFLYWINLLPTMSGLTSLLFAELMKLIGLDSTAGYWITWSLLTVAFLTALGLPLAFHLAASDGVASIFEGTAQLPVVDQLRALADNPAGLAAVFDESTLWRDGAGAGFASLRYPTATKGLVRIWWEGSGALEVAHDDHSIRLRVDSGTPIEVNLRPQDLTGVGVRARLLAAHADLRAEVIDAGDIPLAFPAALDDPGDELATLREHSAHAADFVGVGTTREAAYVIRHAPPSLLTTGFGVAGRSDLHLDALPIVPQAGLGDADSTALGLAADLAALLAMGAAPTLSATDIMPAAAPGLPPLVGAGERATEVYQVFRRWNLDERRVNEWRMIVAGAAVSERPVGAADHHDGLRAHPTPATYASPAAGGEALANAMGWLPVWRAWIKMATDHTADTSATTAEPYTPFVTLAGTGTLQPTNAQLSEAVRFLLDLRA